MTVDVLDTKTLGRATLARQSLLERSAMDVTEAVARVGGIQAQEAKPAFTALWNRIAGFDRADLASALHQRRVVRATSMRATLHLLAAEDLVRFRTTLDPVMHRAMRVLGRRADALDLDALVEVAQDLLARDPMPFEDLRPMLQARFPDADERALGYAVRLQLPLVMVPTDDPWAFPSTGAFTTAASWLDAPLSPLDQSAELASRYLRAFGPASAADFQSWSGLTGARAILGRVDPPLRKYKDDQGRDLFDLVDVPIPDPDVPAPPRFLPEFDSLLLAHADRRRVVHDDHRAALVTKNLRVKAAVLHDGSVCATWSVNRRKDAATLELTPLRPLSPTTLDELGPEAMSVLEFLEPDASRYELSEVPPAR